MFSRKGVYHSDLVTATANGPITLTFTSHPKDSRNKDIAGFLNFLSPTGSEHYLNIETPEIRAQLSQVPLNVPLQVRATGSHAESAIEILGAGAPVPAATPTQAAPAQRPGAAQSSTQQGTGYAAGPHMHPTIMQDMWDALYSAGELEAMFFAHFGRQPTEVTKSIAATLFISFKDTGGRRAMRAKPAPVKVSEPT